MDKQSRRDKYQDKRNNKEKYKVKKQIETQEDKAFMQQISKYSPQKLLKFLQDKYDQITSSNQKLAFKLNNQIGKRLIQFPSQIDSKQFKKLKGYLEAQHVKVSDQNLKKLFQNKQIMFDAQNLQTQIQYPAQNICLIKLIFNYQKPNIYTRKVCIHKVPQQLCHNPLNKRMKKEAIEIIQGLLTFIESINTYQKN